MKIIICDIDGTLADCGHRLHHITGLTKEWAAFYGECDTDAPISAVIELVRALADDYFIVYFTGRVESVRAKTEAWLARHGLPDAPLFMRKDGDYRRDSVVKLEMLKEFGVTNQYAKQEILFALEDRACVVQMWRENGIPCLQVADGDF